MVLVSSVGKADTVKIADFLCAWVPSFRSPRLNSPTLKNFALCIKIQSRNQFYLKMLLRGLLCTKVFLL